jgi:hypothetical protein
MPKAAKMRQTLTEPKEVTLNSNSNNPTSEHAPHVERKYQYCMQNNQWKIIGTNSQQKVPLS